MRIIIIICILGFFTSCKNTKRVSGSNGTPKELSKSSAIEGFQDHVVDFQTFEGKAKMKFEDDEKNLSFKATIRIQKDEKIWVSAGMLGFEGVRALITPDSVKVINRLEKTYYAEPIEYISEITSLPVDFMGLQNAIIGNWLFFDESQAKFEEKEGIVELYSEEDDIVNILWLDNASLLLERQTVLDQVNNRNMEVSYHDYREIKSFAFPYESNIHVSGQEEAWIDMEYSSVVLNSNPSFSFNVSDKYERVN